MDLLLSEFKVSPKVRFHLGEAIVSSGGGSLGRLVWGNWKGGH